MDVGYNDTQYELDSSEAELAEDSSEDRPNFECLTIQVDEDLGTFNEDSLDISDDERTEAERMAESYTEKEIIDKLLKDSISIAEATQLLSQGYAFEDDYDELEDTLVVDQVPEFAKEIEGKESIVKRKRGRGRKTKRQMPAAITGLMGEANLKFATKQFDEAEKMCLELIRRYPHSPEPFETLAMIYEEKNLPMKSVQYWFISAFLSSNPDTWEKLANIFINQLNDPNQAVFCYTRAIKADTKNIDLHWSRAKLLEYLGESGRAVRSYIYMLKFLNPDQGNLGIELAIEIAKIHHSNENITQAQTTLETALKKYKSFVTPDAVNLLLELLLQQDKFLQCVEVLIQQNDIKLRSKKMPLGDFSKLSTQEQLRIATLCTDYEKMAVDLLAKFSIALIYLKKDDIAADIVNHIKKQSVSEFGDVFIEISEAYFNNEKFAESIEILLDVLKCEKFNMPAVWLQYADALSAINKLEEAADAYGVVISLAPQHTSTRVALSNILKILGRTTEALSILDQRDDEGLFDSGMLFEKCQMLKESNEIEQYIHTAKLMFHRHFLNLRSKMEVEAIINLKRVKYKHEAIKEIRSARGELNEPPNEYIGLEVPVDDQWPIFRDVCEILFRQGRYDELESLSFNALGSTEFMKNPELAKEVEFTSLIACLHNKSFYFAYNIVREMVLKQPECSRAWNLLCYIISKTDDIRHNKFLLRLTYKHNDSLPLSILNGHNCLAAGSYKFAMAEYAQVFKQETNEPLISLMLGLTYIHLACQKFSGNKHDLTIKGVALLQTYLHNRGECQESYYNLGRAMHQLNILPQAIHYYKKALDLPPVIDDSEGNFDLTREIAFNLSLVYKKSGNSKLIRYYLGTYIKI